MDKYFASIRDDFKNMHIDETLLFIPNRTKLPSGKAYSSDVILPVAIDKAMQARNKSELYALLSTYFSRNGATRQEYGVRKYFFDHDGKFSLANLPKPIDACIKIYKAGIAVDHGLQDALFSNIHSLRPGDTVRFLENNLFGMQKNTLYNKSLLSQEISRIVELDYNRHLSNSLSFPSGDLLSEMLTRASKNSDITALTYIVSSYNSLLPRVLAPKEILSQEKLFAVAKISDYCELADLDVNNELPQGRSGRLVKKYLFVAENTARSIVRS